MDVNDPRMGLQSWEDVETQIGILSQNKAKKAQIVNRFVAEIAALNANKDKETNDVDFLIQQAESAINGFVMMHLAEFDKKKSKVFNTGKLKVREFEGYEYPKDADLVALLHHLGLEDLIDVKETPSKTAIKLAAKNDEGLWERLEIDAETKVSITIETY